MAKGDTRPQPSTQRRREYRAYINSDAWAQRRAEHRRTHRYRCSICGATRRLDLHHLTYRNQGHEKEGDLTYLCRPHHKEVHRVARARGIENSYNQLRDVTKYVRQQYLLRRK